MPQCVPGAYVRPSDHGNAGVGGAVTGPSSEPPPGLQGLPQASLLCVQSPFMPVRL